MLVKIYNIYFLLFIKLTFVCDWKFEFNKINGNEALNWIVQVNSSSELTFNFRFQNFNARARPDKCKIANIYLLSLGYFPSWATKHDI